MSILSLPVTNPSTPALVLSAVVSRANIAQETPITMRIIVFYDIQLSDKTAPTLPSTT